MHPVDSLCETETYQASKLTDAHREATSQHYLKIKSNVCIYLQSIGYIPEVLPSAVTSYMQKLKAPGPAWHNE